MARFDDRTVVVTGAASGIRLEVTRRFLAAGAFVVAGDLGPEGIPDGAVAVGTDVTAEADVEELVRTAIDRTGRIDVMCNNAGIGSTSDPLACSVEEWDRIFAVNARGVFLGTRAALRHMTAQGSGSIVNTASVAGMVGLKDRAAYCASKGAVIAFTKAVAVQYAAKGIRANCVAPGTVDTPWVQRLLDQADDPAAAQAALVARQPVGRLGTAAEIASAISYLASDEAGFITGEVFVVDGGLTAG
jgi:NAD(P)-dependent dehydrogenase (short-subunit alcohol dehydrogenase family)